MGEIERIRDGAATAHPGGIIGGSGRRGGEGEQRAAEEQRKLTPCPCGSDAVWYHDDATAPAASPHSGSAIGSMSFSGEERPPNLCAECFRDAVPETEQNGWKRYEPPEAVRNTGEDPDQTRGGRVWRE